MKPVLVAYTTNAGSTADVARAIGEELTGAGLGAEVRRLEEVEQLDAYSAAIVGGPMIMGWHRAAVQFLKRHQSALAHVPVAYFMTAMSLTAQGETSVDGIPLCIDPRLPKPPRNANRLGLREGYATAANYVRPVLRAAPAVKPVSVALFGGKLEMYRLKLWQALFVMLIVRATPGRSHNLPFIRAWARELSGRLTHA